MANTFLFSKDNRWLKKCYLDWKMQEGFGTYILIGPSGSGKSLFVGELVEELSEKQGLDYYVYTGQEIEELLLKQVREHTVCQISEAPIMIFEDIDCLLKSDSMKKLFEEFICRYQEDASGEKRLIILTAIDFTAFELNGYAIPVNSLKVNIQVVRKKAAEQQVTLSFWKLLKLTRCRRVSEVEANLRKLKLR